MPPRRNSRRWRWIAGILVLFLIAAAVGIRIVIARAQPILRARVVELKSGRFDWCGHRRARFGASQVRHAALRGKKPNHLLMHAWSLAVFARKLSLQALRQNRRPQW